MQCILSIKSGHTCFSLGDNILVCLLKTNADNWGIILGKGTINVLRLRQGRTFFIQYVIKGNATATFCKWEPFANMNIWDANGLGANKLVTLVTLQLFSTTIWPFLNPSQGGLKQFWFYFIFTARDHIEHQPICYDRWIKQKF